jgi:hypothetical protein
VAQVAAPVAPGQLVADQAVDGGAVGDAQQGLGEAHQGDALLARQGELVHQLVDAAGAPAPGPHGLHQQAGAGFDGGRIGPQHLELAHQGRDDLGFVRPTVAGDGLPVVVQGGLEGGAGCHGGRLREMRL